MLEPKIVAARIHRPVRAEHGTAAFSDWTTPWSHGGFMRLWIHSSGVKSDFAQAFGVAAITLGGAPKLTILELFGLISFRACRSLASVLDYAFSLFESRAGASQARRIIVH
jgi:hypothetical protein